MAIYIDNGEHIKIYHVKTKVEKAIMTLLEADGSLVFSETAGGYGVEIIHKQDKSVLDKMKN